MKKVLRVIIARVKTLFIPNPRRKRPWNSSGESRNPLDPGSSPGRRVGLSLIHSSGYNKELVNEFRKKSIKEITAFLY